MPWYVPFALAIAGVVALARFLARRDREGWWDKEGHGPPEHPDVGVHYRPLATPPPPPFDKR